MKNIEKNYGYEVPVLVKTAEDFRHIFENNPFLKGNDSDIKKLLVTFLFTIPKQSKIEELNINTDKGEEFIFSRDIIYLYYPNGYGSSKLFFLYRWIWDISFDGWS